MHAVRRRLLRFVPFRGAQRKPKGRFAQTADCGMLGPQQVGVATNVRAARDHIVQTGLRQSSRRAVRAAWREPYPADRARCIAGVPTEKTARGRARRPISANGPRVFHCRSGGCMETTFVISRARGIPEQTAVNFLRRIFRGRARSADADRRYPRAMSFARVVRKPAKSCAKVVSLLTFCASSVILIKIDAAFTQTAATRGMPEAAAGSW